MLVNIVIADNNKDEKWTIGVVLLWSIYLLLLPCCIYNHDNTRTYTYRTSNK